MVLVKTIPALGEENEVKAVKRRLKDGNRPFPSSPGPLFQNEGRCSAFDMEIIFHSHANKTHLHKKGCASSLILKVRVFGTRTWPIRCTTDSIPHAISNRPIHYLANKTFRGPGPSQAAA